MNGTGFTSETDVDPTIPQALASIPSQDSNLPPALGNGIVRVPTLSTPETPLNPQDTPIKTVKPVYPVLAKNSNIQGDVVVGFSIRKDGTIERAHVLRGNPILGLAALAAVQQWRYPPRYQEKYSASAASLERQITMKFNLSGR
jgi:TonB family protein